MRFACVWVFFVAFTVDCYLVCFVGCFFGYFGLDCFVFLLVVARGSGLRLDWFACVRC